MMEGRRRVDVEGRILRIERGGGVAAAGCPSPSPWSPSWRFGAAFSSIERERERGSEKRSRVRIVARGRERRRLDLDARTGRDGAGSSEIEEERGSRFDLGL